MVVVVMVVDVVVMVVVVVVMVVMVVVVVVVMVVATTPRHGTHFFTYIAATSPQYVSMREPGKPTELRDRSLNRWPIHGLLLAEWQIH